MAVLSKNGTEVARMQKTTRDGDILRTRLISVRSNMVVLEKSGPGWKVRFTKDFCLRRVGQTPDQIVQYLTEQGYVRTAAR